MYSFTKKMSYELFYPSKLFYTVVVEFQKFNNVVPFFWVKFWVKY